MENRIKPIEEAKNLLNEFMDEFNSTDLTTTHKYTSLDEECAIFAISCAYICCDKIIAEYQQISDLKSHIIIFGISHSVVELIEYWKSVKHEIEKMKL